MAFNHNLARFRYAAGMNQEQLAERIGVSRSTIAKWEAGKGTPKITNLIAVSRALGVTVDALLQGEIAEYDEACREAVLPDLK